MAMARSIVLLFVFVVYNLIHVESRPPSFASYALHSPGWTLRAGAQPTEELTLDEKVQAAMKKLGIYPPPPPPSKPPPVGQNDSSPADDCADGVCPATPPPPPNGDSATTATVEEDPTDIAHRLAADLNVDNSLAWASLAATSSDGANGNRVYSESAAKEMIQQELKMAESVKEDSPEITQLVQEGFDPFLARRALAFAEMNMADARAILLADQQDAENEDTDAPVDTTDAKPEFPIVTVDANVDPTKLAVPDAASNEPTPQSVPTPAKREDVIFEATASDIQELVLESPVPVLLDVYADWCGPCKALTPALEEMAIKAGGAFRLVKVNSDNEKAVASGALEVRSLPTVFGIKDGEIQNMFQGMPRSEDGMKNFMMGLLLPGANYEPPLTTNEKERFEALTIKLIKTAGAASFSFAARERLQDRIATHLKALASANGFLDAESTAQTIRSLLSNIIRKPKEAKFRTVNLSNKVIESKIAQYPEALAILKSCGFAKDATENRLTMGKGKRLINIAPLSVARDYIDKWADKSRYEVAKAARQKKDEEDRKKLLEERALAGDDDEEEEDDETEEVDPNACIIQLRMDGKKKLHKLELHADDPLKTVLEHLPVPVTADQEVQITCVARKLIVKSSEKKKIKTSLRSMGLAPSATIVVSLLGDSTAKTAGTESTGRLKERVAAQKKKKTGSHTMQSIGIYSKDDNAKGELIDGGGGVWYEHDVSEDEEEEQPEGIPPAAEEKPAEESEADSEYDNDEYS